jgi:hypothetical protein
MGVEYTHKHIMAVHERLMQYEFYFESGVKEVFGRCEICDTTRKLGSNVKCTECLFTYGCNIIMTIKDDGTLVDNADNPITDHYLKHRYSRLTWSLKILESGQC